MAKWLGDKVTIEVKLHEFCKNDFNEFRNRFVHILYKGDDIRVEFDKYNFWYLYDCDKGSGRCRSIKEFKERMREIHK